MNILILSEDTSDIVRLTRISKNLFPGYGIDIVVISSDYSKDLEIEQREKQQSFSKIEKIVQEKEVEVLVSSNWRIFRFFHSIILKNLVDALKIVDIEELEYKKNEKFLEKQALDPIWVIRTKIEELKTYQLMDKLIVKDQEICDRLSQFFDFCEIEVID